MGAGTVNGWGGGAMSPQGNVVLKPGSLVVGRNADGRLETFACNEADGTIHHANQVEPNGGWTSVDGSAWYQLAPNPNGVSFGDVSQSSNGPPGQFGNSFALTGPTIAVATNSGPAFVLELFAIGSDNRPYHIYQTSDANPTGWTDWLPMSWPPNGFPNENVYAVAVGNLGPLVVVYLGDSGVWFTAQPWDSPQRIAGPTLTNVVLLNSPAGLTIVGDDQANPGVGRYTTLTDVAGAWSPWQSIPAVNNQLPRPVLGWHYNGGGDGGGLDVFALLGDNNLSRSFIPGGVANALLGAGAFDPIGGPVMGDTFAIFSGFSPVIMDVGNLPPSFGANFDFQFQCIFTTDRDQDFLLMNALQCFDTDGSLETPFGTRFIDVGSASGFGPITQIAVGANADGRLDVFMIEGTNQCYHCYQDFGQTDLSSLDIPNQH